MKYYLTYLNEEGESTKIELSNLPFFKDKSAGKILNIIAFYNQLDVYKRQLLHHSKRQLEFLLMLLLRVKLMN